MSSVIALALSPSRLLPFSLSALFSSPIRALTGMDHAMGMGQYIVNLLMAVKKSGPSPPAQQESPSHTPDTAPCWPAYPQSPIRVFIPNASLPALLLIRRSSPILADSAHQEQRHGPTTQLPLKGMIPYNATWRDQMTYSTLRMNGREFILVPKTEFDRLKLQDRRDAQKAQRALAQYRSGKVRTVSHTDLKHELGL